MKKCNIMILTFFMICLAACAADVIKSQKRDGATLVVTYADGRVVTNSLFLAMSPDVKKEIARINGEKIIVDTIKSVAADTRANIPETATMSDAEVAGLYLQQTKKSADALAAIAPTNTLEYLIGAGMRQDLNKKD